MIKVLMYNMALIPRSALILYLIDTQTAIRYDEVANLHLCGGSISDEYLVNVNKMVGKNAMNQLN